jgi:hypothetical protein
MFARQRISQSTLRAVCSSQRLVVYIADRAAVAATLQSEHLSVVEYDLVKRKERKFL